MPTAKSPLTNINDYDDVDDDGGDDDNDDDNGIDADDDNYGEDADNNGDDDQYCDGGGVG